MARLRSYTWGSFQRGQGWNSEMGITEVFDHAQGLRVQGFSFAQRWQHLVAWWQKAAAGGGCGGKDVPVRGQKAEDLYVGILP